MSAAQIVRRPVDHPPLPRGLVNIIDIRCKECDFCIRFCPKDILEISETYTAKGYRPVRVISGQEDNCIACRFCEDVCPEYAIYIVEFDAGAKAGGEE